MESNKPVRVAVVGSREFDSYKLVENTVDSILAERGLKDVLIVSGGARGVDTLAELYAIRRNLPKKVYKANWTEYGKAAGPLRNTQIVENSDLIIAFRLPGSRGTQNTINQAKERGVETIVIDVSVDHLKNY